jgi:hypothetical protein
MITNIEEKNLRPNKNMEWLGKQKAMHSPLEPMHDFRCAWCESKAMSKMMLKKEWLCNLYKMLIYSLFCKSHKRRNTNHHIQWKELPLSFKWALRGNGLELLAPITSNKYEQLFDRNLALMIGTSAQLTK